MQLTKQPKKKKVKAEEQIKEQVKEKTNEKPTEVELEDSTKENEDITEVVEETDVVEEETEETTNVEDILLDEQVEPTLEPKVKSFSDGLVDSRFKNSVVVHSADMEVYLLQNFLSYFKETETFIGNINTRTSFMHKKGGRLL